MFAIARQVKNFDVKFYHEEKEILTLISDNTGISIRNSKDKQEHAKLRVIEQLFEWEKQGYKIVKVETEN